MAAKIKLDSYWRQMCEHIESGGSLREWCRKKGTPDFSTVKRALRDCGGEYRAQYARAREDSADASHDRILDTAKKVTDGSLEPDRARIEIDARKWSAGRMKPKKYGDRIFNDVNAKVDMSATISPAQELKDYLNAVSKRRRTSS
jgi:hypothetical protein